MNRLFDAFYARLSTMFLLLILALGAGWVLIAFRSASHVFDEVEQRLNREYARSIADELGPLVAQGFAEGRVVAVIHYMMVLNPMVEIYLLDNRGKILVYFLNPGERIVRDSVDLGPVKAFVDGLGHTLSTGEDPRSTTRTKPFSAAPVQMGRERGYVYIILGGERYEALLKMIRESYYLRAGIVAFILALVATILVGFSVFFLLTRRLRSLADVVRGFEQGNLGRRVEVRGNDELGALGRNFNKMASTIEADVEKLRLAERMRTDLIGNISHDLRSPLASIKGYLETMVLKAAQLVPEEMQRFLDICIRNTTNIQRLVEDLLELAMLDARQVSFKPEPMQVADLAQDVVLKLTPQAERRRGHPLGGPRGRTAPCFRRRGYDRAGTDEPDRQRPTLHPPHGLGPCDAYRRAWWGPNYRYRHRGRDRPRGYPAYLRAVLPGGQEQGQGDGRSRLRAGDRSANRGTAREHARCAEQAG